MAAKQARYVLGHAPEEMQRLIRQGALISELTDQVLRQGGLAPGMRVLDVGCGAGDVSLLAADLVGPAGSVLGIDRAAGALDVARWRAADRGLTHVAFEVGDLMVPPAGPFDAVVGRLVLMFVPEPLEALRGLAAHLRPGGVMIFQERAGAPEAFYDGPLFRRAVELQQTVLRASGAQTDLGLRLPGLFRAAGLKEVRSAISQRLSDAGEHGVLSWLAETVETFLPAARQAGLALAEDLSSEDLLDRLVAELVAADGVAVTPRLVGAWGHLPG